MLRHLPVFVALIGLFGRTPDEMEGRKRTRELMARTYVHCGANDFRLVEEFKIVEYQALSHLLNVLETAPENKVGVQYRGVIERSCGQKRIYTLSRARSQWRGQWSEWASCGKLDPDNPLVLVPNKAGEPTAILKRAERAISKDQAKRLAAFFHVSVAPFI